MIGVEVVDFHLTRTMDIVAVVEVDAHVGHTFGVAVAEEEQVAGLAIVPIIEACAGACLLRGIALQDYAGGEVGYLCQS